MRHVSYLHHACVEARIVTIERNISAKPPLPPLHLTLIGAAAQLVPARPGAISAALRRAPRGDGHTASLRRFLAGCGYAVHGWGPGANLGPTAIALDGLELLLSEVHAKHGRKVSLIGHSLGGVIARELAKQKPEQVRQLVLLASPIRHPTASPLEPIYKLLSRWHRIDATASAERLNAPPDVPVTSIFTRSDGIIAWESCLEAAGPQRENVAVRGSHGTMVRNARAWRVIAERLAQAEGEWQPYRG